MTSAIAPAATQGGLSKFAAVAVRLAALWLLTGALFKLFAGSPKLLPPLVTGHSPFSANLTFHLAIAIELTIVWLAMLKPHRGWLVITALFAFFLVVLVDQLLRGAESCGCLGDTIKVPPALMMGVDGSLLAFMLATQPWKNLSGPGLSSAVLALGVAVSIAAPWIVIPSPTNVVVTVDPNTGVKSANVRWVDMEPEKWIGQSIFDVTQFTQWVAPEKIPTDGRIVLWRQGCDHCKKHLEEMANEKNESQLILLVQVQDDLKSSRAVEAMPNGPNVTLVALPENQEFGVTTPLELVVEGGVVKSVLDEKAFEDARKK
jgi:hypothetical protein